MRNEQAAVSTRTDARDAGAAADRIHDSRRSPDRSRRGYPSDLNDVQWEGVARLLANVSRTPRIDSRVLREVADAVNYRWSTGCSWRMLPHDFPEWTRVYGHFRRWRQRGLLSAVRDVALQRAPKVTRKGSSVRVGDRETVRSPVG